MSGQRLKIGSVTEFDTTEMRVMSLLGKRVGIWRQGDGTWRAMEMICRHQNGDLSQGRRNGDIVTCPRHGWEYDLSTGECLTESWASLRHYEVSRQGDDLFLSLPPLPTPPHQPEPLDS